MICVDSGYEIHFAGAAGLDIKGTEILGQVKTEDEAVEYIAALVQMYREQARYLERIYKWAKRIGVDEIRRQIVQDGERRRSYFERFVFSQKFARSIRGTSGSRARTSMNSGRWRSWVLRRRQSDEQQMGRGRFAR